MRITDYLKDKGIFLTLNLMIFIVISIFMYIADISFMMILFILTRNPTNISFSLHISAYICMVSYC